MWALGGGGLESLGLDEAELFWYYRGAEADRSTSTWSLWGGNNLASRGTNRVSIGSIKREVLSQLGQALRVAVAVVRSG